MAVPTRAALTTLLCSLPLSSALAGDITDIQGIRGVATEPEARALAGGGALQWWPVAEEEGDGWTLRVQQVSSDLATTWTATLPLSADALVTTEARRGVVAALTTYGGQRSRTVAQVLPHDGGAFVVYPDGEQLMGVQIGADGAAAEAAALAPLTQSGAEAVHFAVSAEGDRVAVVDEASRLAVVQADGTVALQAQLPYTEAYEGEGTGTKVDRKLARKKTGWDLWAPAFGADGAVLAVGVHDEEGGGSVAWFGDRGTPTAITDIDGIGRADEVRALVSGSGTVLVFSEDEPQSNNMYAPGSRGTALDRTRIAFVSPTEKRVETMDVATPEGLTEDLGGREGYFPGRLRLLEIEADGAGGILTAMRSTKIEVQEVTTVDTKTGLTDTDYRTIFRVGNVVLQRISAEGEAIWTQMLPGEAKVSRAPVRSMGAAPLTVRGDTVQVAYLSHDCGMQALRKSGRWSVGTLAMADGAERSISCFGDEIPAGVTLSRGLTVPSGGDHLTLGFRADPTLRAFSLFLAPGKIDNDRVIVINGDPEAESVRGWAKPFAKGEDAAAFEAGHAYAQAMRPRGIGNLPGLRGYLIGLGAGAVGSSLTSGFGAAPTVGLVGGTAIGGASARYFARQPRGYWGAQSPSFQQGYRNGFDRKAVRRATIWGTVGAFTASGVAAALASGGQ